MIVRVVHQKCVCSKDPRVMIYSQDRSLVKVIHGPLAKNFVTALEGSATGYFEPVMTKNKPPDIASVGERAHGLEWS